MKNALIKNGKKRFVFFNVIGALLLAGVILIGGNPDSFGIVRGEEPLYTITLNEANKPSSLNASTFTSGTGMARYVSFDYSLAKTTSGYHAVFDVGGLISNDATTQITSIKTMVATFDGGAATLQTGYSPSTLSDSQSMTSGGTITFTDNPYYFSISNTGSSELSLTSLVITYSCSPIQFSLSYREVESFSTTVIGAGHSLSLTSMGRVFAWGRDTYGQLGDDTTTDKYVPTEITSGFSLETSDKVVSLAAGWYHSLAVTSTGRVFTWGYNNYGQLGDNTTTQRNVPTEITSGFSLASGDKVVSLVAGTYHSLAVTSMGRVFTWGYNNAGELGDNTTTQREVPTEITSGFSLASGDKVVSFVAGAFHSLAVTSAGRVYGWGYNGYGQLGDTTTTSKSVPTEFTSRFSLATGDKVVSLAAGYHHSLALTSMGRVYAWGWNGDGQLGDNTTVQKTLLTEITSGFSLATGDKVVALVAGAYHSMAITSTGRVYTWGNNDYGQLGDTTTADKHIPTEITSRFNLASGIKVVSLISGPYHSLTVTSTGRVYAWGYNGFGGLGDNTTVQKNVPTEISSSLLSIPLMNAIVYDYGAITTEYIPVREGYTFSGWFTNATLTNTYTFTTMPANDVTLYGYFYPSA